jgi:hypothetical protein
MSLKHCPPFIPILTLFCPPFQEKVRTSQMEAKIKDQEERCFQLQLSAQEGSTESQILRDRLNLNESTLSAQVQWSPV